MNTTQTHFYEFGDFRVDAAKRLLIKGDDEQISLTPRVFDTLLYLVENSGKVIEKDELMNAIWTDTIVEENNLSQNISILRRVLGEKRGEDRFIRTIPGRGFKFVAEVTPSSSKFRVQSEQSSEMPDAGCGMRDAGFYRRRPKAKGQKPKSKDFCFPLYYFIDCLWHGRLSLASLKRI